MRLENDVEERIEEKSPRLSQSRITDVLTDFDAIEEATEAADLNIKGIDQRRLPYCYEDFWWDSFRVLATWQLLAMKINISNGYVITATYPNLGKSWVKIKLSGERA